MASSDEYQQREFFEKYPLHETKMFKLRHQFALICSVCKGRIKYCGGCGRRTAELIEINNN